MLPEVPVSPSPIRLVSRLIAKPRSGDAGSNNKNLENTGAGHLGFKRLGGAYLAGGGGQHPGVVLHAVVLCSRGATDLSSAPRNHQLSGCHPRNQPMALVPHKK